MYSDSSQATYGDHTCQRRARPGPRLAIAPRKCGYHRGMKIDTLLLLPAAALVSSVLLLLAGRKRIFEVIAVVASGAWLVLHLGLIKWPFKEVAHALVIGGTLLVTGVIVYLKVTNKREVTAATVVAILGGILLAGSIGSLK